MSRIFLGKLGTPEIHREYNPVTKETVLIDIISYQGTSSPREYRLLTALKQNFVGHRFKDGREVERAVTRWLTT